MLHPYRIKCSRNIFSSLANCVHIIINIRSRHIYFPDSQALYAVKPEVIRMRCLATWYNVKCKAGRKLSLQKILLAVFSQIRNPGISDGNQCPIMAFKRCSYIKNTNTVCTKREPVAAQPCIFPVVLARRSHHQGSKSLPESLREQAR